MKKLWRGQEDQRKPRMSELFDSETLKQFIVHIVHTKQNILSLLDIVSLRIVDEFISIAVNVKCLNECFFLQNENF